MSAIVKPRKERKHVYRVGDVVSVVEPLLFERVGYPISLKAAMVKTDLDHSVAIYAFMRSILGHDVSRPDCFRAINKALAYEWLKGQSFGGGQRTIHTILTESWRGIRAKVKSKRVVKTGLHCGGGHWSGGEDSEWEPGGLADERAHVILTLDPISDDAVPCGDGGLNSSWGEHFEIEECHVAPYRYGHDIARVLRDLCRIEGLPESGGADAEDGAQPPW